MTDNLTLADAIILFLAGIGAGFLLDLAARLAVRGGLT